MVSDRFVLELDEKSWWNSLCLFEMQGSGAGRLVEKPTKISGLKKEKTSF